MNGLILLAAGSGTRMHGSVTDKILTPLAGQPLFLHPLRAFARSGVAQQAVLTYRDEAQKAELQSHIPEELQQSIDITYTPGGATRQQSVLAALEILPQDTQLVFVHDAARPLITAAAIQTLHRAAQTDGAAALAHPVTDTIKRLPQGAAPQNAALEDLQRDRLWAMETPQAFPYTDLLTAYRQVEQDQQTSTDDAAAYATLGKTVTLVDHSLPNPKLTTPQDLPYLEHLLNNQSETKDRK
ncbi:MAG: 2-C-methyl-D-erythritol 4-phosphate cytidylyltransferase [Coraliomargaritaceae bacterium]